MVEKELTMQEIEYLKRVNSDDFNKLDKDDFYYKEKFEFHFNLHAKLYDMFHSGDYKYA